MHKRKPKAYATGCSSVSVAQIFAGGSSDSFTPLRRVMPKCDHTGMLGLRCTVAICVLLGTGLVAADPPVVIRVDATHAPQRLFSTHITMPVKPGPLTLLYPQWIPGDHQPTGPIADVVGLKITGGGQTIAWSRDLVNMYAFHLTVPEGVSSLDISMQMIAAPGEIGADSSTFSTQQLAIVNFSSLVLYPKGAPSDQQTYQATLVIPDGWRYGTALPIGRESSNSVEFKPSSLTTLVDSPVLAGRYFQTVDLAPGSSVPQVLHLAGDSAQSIELQQEGIDHFRAMVAQEHALFGEGHFRSYHFLLSLSDRGLHYAGLEHHESSDNRLGEQGITSEGARKYNADVLPHEMAHSWNGKYRRPAGLATKDFSEPMKGDLLWVYEGLTDYLGRVIAARAGFRNAEEFRDDMAITAAQLDNQAGRKWRPLEDTAVSVQNLFYSREDYSDLRRSADYYPESSLIWMDADVLIRQQSKGARSLDDFVRAWVAGPAGMPAVKPYTFEDVVATLNSIQPYDWKGFLNARVYSVAPHAPLGGIEAGGWKLVYTPNRSEYFKLFEGNLHAADFSYSLGLKLKDDGSILDVLVDRPAHKTGMTPNTKIIAVQGRQYSSDSLREALKAAVGSTEPIELLVKDGDYYKTYKIDYHGGERYPRLERDASKPDLLSEIAKPRK